jgi:NAD(P)-dependent dehydrogenase (short-subunit alcohol dehydrogenase family)
MEKFTDAEWAACLKVLHHLKEHPYDNPDNEQFKTLITGIYKQARKTVRKETEQHRRAEDLVVLFNTRIAQDAIANTATFSVAEESNVHTYQEVKRQVNCYICGAGYREVHFFYNRLCPACAEFNYAQRSVAADLTGRNVILTGGRVKIGYAAALKFLRNGANLVLTTRFPALALEQLQQEPDYAEWQDRLLLYGLDLRNLKAVDTFIRDMRQHFGHLDILVNNAAQTIQYPAAYYQPLLQKEQQLLLHAPSDQLLPNTTPLAGALALPEATASELPGFTPNRFGQPVDPRDKNSWNATLEEVDTYELLEVNLINHISPYLLIRELMPLFRASVQAQKFIINVSSSEGQFSYDRKTIFHPHTNMTKAALNMLTRTSAPQLLDEGVYMNSVDVGWVSTGAVERLRTVQFEQGYIPPLDPVDGAARILHPIAELLQGGEAWSGVLLKNYRKVDW